ncbi:hypothetical protein GQ457_04G005840 [Hibiscus cannabinus]
MWEFQDKAPTEWDILTKEARKALKLGKKTEMQIQGNEEEVGVVRRIKVVYISYRENKMEIVSWIGFECESLGFKESVIRAKGIDGLIQESNKTTLLEDDARKIWYDNDYDFVPEFWETFWIVAGISTSLEVEVDEVGVLVHPLASWNLTVHCECNLVVLTMQGKKVITWFTAHNRRSRFGRFLNG